MNTSERIRILQKITDGDCIPSPAPVIIRLIELASDDAVSMKQVVSVIEKDPGLTTRVLKLANSPFYARKRDITSISQAVFLIGFNRLRIMALSLSLRDSFPVGKVRGMDYELFWRSSLYRALIAQGLARLTPRDKGVSEEELFSAGLILEIGMLLLFHVCPDILKDSFPGGASMSELIRWETEHLGVTHREVGAIVLARWRFPPFIVESQKHYGKEALAENRSISCRILEVSRIITEVFFGRGIAFIEKTASLLNIAATDIHEVLHDSFARFDEYSSLLYLKASSAEDMLNALEKANTSLARIAGSLQENVGKALHLISTPAEVEESEGVTCCGESRRAISNVLDAVAHEIRNPLTAIGGFAQRLAKSADAKEDLVKYADIIVQESQRLQQVMSEISAISQGYSLSTHPGDLIETVDEALDGVRASLDQKNIEVIKNYDPQPFVVDMDQAAIRNALQYLLDSMIKYVEGESTPVKIWVEVFPASEPTDSVRISIQVKGLVLPESIRRIFFGVDFSSKAFLGSAIGFLRAWRVFEAHAGRIEFIAENDTNKFLLHLPTPRSFETHPPASLQREGS